jgi:hypothetical protein
MRQNAERKVRALSSAERLFKKEQAQIEGAKAWGDYRRGREATLANMARLRELRLSRREK